MPKFKSICRSGPLPGLDDAAAKAFSLEFSGSGEAKKGINISPEEFAKAKPAVARFAAANTAGDPASVGTYGELAGLLLGFKKNQTAKGLVGDLAGFNKILSLGVGDNPDAGQGSGRASRGGPSTPRGPASSRNRTSLPHWWPRRR